MKTKLLGVVAACVLALTVGAANASTITYYVDEPLTVDAGYGTGSVTGWITTDGTIGPLNNGNLVNFSITAQFGSYSYSFVHNFSGALPFGFATDPLIATPDQLLFNFDNAGVFAFSTGAGTDYYVGWQPGSFYDIPCCALVAMLGFDPVKSTATNYYAIESYSGPYPDGLVPIAEIQTPLPAALPLFASGLAGLGLLGWRRKRKALSA